MKRLLAGFMAFIILLTVFTYIHPVKAESEKTLNIHAIYLTKPDGTPGEGDAVLVESDGHYLLMDAGMGYYPYVDNESTVKKNDVSQSIMDYLDSLGIDENTPLDIYVSHIHNDHFGGIYNIIMSGKYNIGKLYVPARALGNANQDHDFVYRNVFTNEMNRYVVPDDSGNITNYFDGIEVVYLAPPTISCPDEIVTDNFTFGSASVKIIGPVRLCTSTLALQELKKKDSAITADLINTDQIENNNSLCAVVTCGKNKFVTMGDALEFEENDLVSKYKGTTTLKADVFKENHHGYYDSGKYTGSDGKEHSLFITNTEDILALLKPKYSFCQNKKEQTNKWVPWVVTRYGENCDIYAEGKTIVYNLVTNPDNTTTVKRTFCGHPLNEKEITVTKISTDMEKHTLKVFCPECKKTVTATEGHIWDSNGKCTVCGYQCSHTYVNDAGETKNNYSSVDQCCLNCRMHCKHESWWAGSGKCTTCYILCEHPKWDSSTGKCKTCGHACEHDKGSTKTTTKATKTANGKIVTKCKQCGMVQSTKTIYHPSKYSLSTSTYTYDGKKKGPGISIYDTKGTKLVKGTDYTVSSPSGRTAVGKYTYKITFIGNYSGTATLTITIKPKSTSLSLLTSIKNGFKVKWSKQATQTTGYQIQAAADSKFKKDVHSYTWSKNSTVSASITKNLKAGKKYYVRIRTFKTVTINGKSQKIYSSWSSAKSGTTKK